RLDLPERVVRRLRHVALCVNDVCDAPFRVVEGQSAMAVRIRRLRTPPQAVVPIVHPVTVDGIGERLGRIAGEPGVPDAAYRSGQLIEYVVLEVRRSLSAGAIGF